MSKKTSLSEIMGKAGANLKGKKLSMDHLHDLLGEALPEIPVNAVGRHRLVSALRNRFGVGWRNLPGVQDIVKDFDSKLEFETRLHKIKEIKYKPKEKK